MLKKCLLCFLTLFLVMRIYPESYAADISAKAAIVLEASTGTVLYEKNADEPMGIASTTKIMTALVALEDAELDSIVTVPAQCVGTEGSSLYLKEGERLPLRELLYGMLLESGNDAAVAVAIHVSGSVEAFVERMNDKAEALGCQNTHFVNPNGLYDSGHYSSAHDLAIIMAAAMENATFVQITSTKSISFEDRTFQNHNKLLWLYDGVIGGKTGYTQSSGRTLVTCAEREGMRLIIVTLDDPDDWDDHVSLYDEMFSTWSTVSICRKGVAVGNVPVIAGTEMTVDVVPEMSLTVLIKRDRVPEVELELPRFLYADVSAGNVVGTLRATDGEEELGTVRLVSGNTVVKDSSQKLSFLEKLLRGLGLFT